MKGKVKDHLQARVERVGTSSGPLLHFSSSLSSYTLLPDNEFVSRIVGRRQG